MNVGVEKIKLSRLLVQRINEFKMKEIQRKTPEKNSNCKLFLNLELTSYIQAVDDSSITLCTIWDCLTSWYK